MSVSRKIPKNLMKVIEKFQDNELLTTRELIKILPITNNTYYTIKNTGKASIRTIKKLKEFLKSN